MSVVSKSRVTYVKWAEAILGHRLPAAKWAYNHAAGAIESPKSFRFFRRCFKQRLLRLQKAFSANARNYQLILKKISDVGTKNWSGPYAELVAYDFLASFTEVVPEVAPQEATLGPFVRESAGGRSEEDLEIPLSRW